MSYFISVIIPVFNAEKYLEDCLESIISSDVFDMIEILLVNDGSKDGSGNICDSYCRKHKNIKAFHIENAGVSNARNVGLMNATADYVTFCDADDYYISDIFLKAVAVLKANSADLCFYNLLYENQTVSRFSYPFDKNVVSNVEKVSSIFKYMLKNESFNSSCNKFFKRSVLQKNQISFKRGQKHGEDRDFVLKFLSVCKSWYYLDEEAYFYRYVKTSAVNKSRTDYFDNISHEMTFKLDISKSFDIDYEEVRAIITETAVRQVMSSVFTASEGSFSGFRVALKKLFENNTLMAALKQNKDVKFYNFAHKKAFNSVLSEKILRCWIIIKFFSLKEKIYKIIH